MKIQISIAAILAALVCCLTGCTSPTSPLDQNQRSAGEIAVAYIEAFVDGRYDEARGYVVSSDQGVLDVLTMSEPPTSTVQISVGSTEISSKRATVILVGEICQSETENESEYCIENSDPHADTPEFTVRLIKDNGEWKVTLYT